MSTFFNDTMTGILQAIAIEKGEIPVTEVNGMPAKTYRSTENVPLRFESVNENISSSQTKKRR